jgi:DNA-binding MarR family transcriptional regulator
MENSETLRGHVPPPRLESPPRAVHPGWLLSEPVEAPADPGPDESTRFGAFRQLMRTACALDRAAVDALSDLDLTAGAFFALLELDAAGAKGLAPSELARRLAVARRTATLYVDILARQGWVERQAHPDDRRMVLAHLTPVGTRLLTELGTAYKRRLAALLGDVSSIQAERMRQLLALVPLDVERPSPFESIDLGIATQAR